MDDLTDELTVGWHYIEHAKFSNHTIDFLYPTGDWKFSNKESVKKVIAPVPSYEELQSLVSDKLAKNESEENITELEDEIRLLKTALKYNNTTAKVALDFIKKDERYSNQVKLIKAMEEMINDTQKVLK